MDLEMNVGQNMEDELLQGLNSDVNQRRLGEIKDIVSSVPSSQLETDSVKTPVSEVVKKLQKETVEMFPDKKDVPTTTTKNDVSKTNNEDIVAKRGKRIFGMTPPVFGLVAVGAVLGGIALYQKFKPAK